MQSAVVQNDDEYDAVSAVVAEFISPAATIGWGKEKGGIIGINDSDLVDVFIGGGLDEILEGVGHVAHEGSAYYPWSVAVAIARQTCRSKPARVIAFVRVQEMRDRLEASVAPSSTSVFVPRGLPTWPLWALIREWCGQDAAMADELARARNEVVRLSAVFASAVGLVANRVGEAPARRLFARAYPDVGDRDWRDFLTKASDLAD